MNSLNLQKSFDLIDKIEINKLFLQKTNNTQFSQQYAIFNRIKCFLKVNQDHPSQ